MSVEMGSALARPPHTLRCALATVWCSDYGCDSRLGCSGPRAQSLELAIIAVPTIAATRAAHPAPQGHRPAWIFMCPFPCTILFSAICVGQTSDPGFKYNRGHSSQLGLLSTCTRSACKFSCLLRLLIFRDNMRLARAFRSRCQDRNSGDSATGSAQVA